MKTFGLTLGAAVALVAMITVSDAEAVSMDVGDAPAPYPTAIHVFETSTFERLGDTLYVSEVTNTESPPGWTASPDDDGVQFQGLVKGGTALVAIDIRNFFQFDAVSVWVDFNADASWETGERVVWAGFASTASPPSGPLWDGAGGPLANSGSGIVTFQFQVPQNAVGPTAAIRARLFDASDPGLAFDPNNPSPSATVKWGEVEDYLVPYEAADAAIPEPGAIGLLACAAVALAARRVRPPRGAGRSRS